jgi:hypothetical protein
MATFTALIPSLGKNVPGILYLAWADIADIDTIPAANATTLEMAAPITMVATKKFYRLECMRPQSRLLEESQGEEDAAHYTFTFTGKVKGMESAIAGGLNLSVGERGVLLAVYEDGSARLMGNKAQYAFVSALKGDSGASGSGDARGYEITIRSYGHSTLMPFYTDPVEDLL